MMSFGVTPATVKLAILAVSGFVAAMAGVLWANAWESVSVSQFNRQFRKKFHTTPRAYLTNVRMNAACHLLVTTDLPISDISLQTGFYDQSHFANTFRRATGMTPRDWRSAFRVQH